MQVWARCLHGGLARTRWRALCQDTPSSGATAYVEDPLFQDVVLSKTDIAILWHPGCISLAWFQIFPSTQTEQNLGTSVAQVFAAAAKEECAKNGAAHAAATKRKH